MLVPPNTAIIGKLPGYNENIDKDRIYEQDLLKGLAFIDMIPMSYTFGSALKEGNLSDLFKKDLGEVLDRTSLFKSDDQTSLEIFKGILKRMQKDFRLNDDFTSTNMLRLIAANDSTFTETFSNSFETDNSIFSTFNETINKAGQNKYTQILSKGTTAYGQADMLKLIGNLQKGATGTGVNEGFADLATGAFFGMKFGAPSQWTASSYTSTLNVFIKLIAPTGTEKCIQENIIKPLLYLTAATSPITFGGLMYGFPLLWDIRARGIATFRLGAIAAMSIIRGTFETTFNNLLQPTIIDVRLTIVPVLNDFASQIYKEDQKSIYTRPQDLGVQNPSDTFGAVINSSRSSPTERLNEEILSIKL
jgi:hypothetical protein